MSGEGSPPEDAEADFAALLRGHRLAAGLTQEELAEAAGVAPRTVGNLERGAARRPRPATVGELADALGLTGAARERLVRAARTERRLAGERDYAPEPWVCALPEDPPGFVERAAEAAALAALADDALRTGLPRVAVVTGQGGVGKTAVAVRAARALAPRFPGSARYLDLRGADPHPPSAAACLDRLLRSFGVPEARLPTRPDDRRALYRSLARDRGGVLVLDDAAGERQVRPLLPRGGPWLVVVTARGPVGGPADARLPLDLLDPAPARALVAGLIGARRAAGEPAAVDDLVQLCGRLPLALRVAGLRLASRPGWSVRHLAERLRDERRRLDVLTAGDLGIRASFAVSYDQLDPGVRALFRWLALVPVPVWTPVLAAALAGTPEPAARAALDALADAGLAHRAGGDGHRAHDLVRIFARERALAEDDPALRAEVCDRASQELLAVAAAAGRVFDHGSDLGRWGSAAEALAWLDRERDGWLWALRHAAARGAHAGVLAAAEGLHWYSSRRPLRAPWAEVFALGVGAAVALGDPREEVLRRNQHGWALRVAEQRPEDGLAEHERALALCGRFPDPRPRAWSHYYCAMAMSTLGGHATAVEHLRPAVELFDRDGYPLGSVLARKELATALRETGGADEAADLLAAATDIWADRADGSALHHLIAAVLRMEAGRTANLRHRHAEAIDHLTAAAEIHRAALNTYALHWVLRATATAHLGLGDHPGAIAALRAAAEHAHREGDLPEQAGILHELGRVHHAAGEHPAARAAWRRALAVCATLDTPSTRPIAAATRRLLARTG